jgi:predicted nucleotidyltransferase
MRLRPEDIATIRELVHEAYGPDVRLILFGSRVDDTARGGDIDLLVEIDEQSGDAPHSLMPERRLKARLSEALRGRKVDLVVHSRHRPPTPIVRIARAEGIVL